MQSFVLGRRRGDEFNMVGITGKRFRYNVVNGMTFVALINLGPISASYQTLLPTWGAYTPRR